MKDNYRFIMDEEISNGVCKCCGNNFLSILIHHINGNHDDDNKKNLIAICKKCHPFVHFGFTKRNNLNNEIRENILKVRQQLLIKKYGFSLKDSEDRIKYERAISSNRGAETRCVFCNSKNNLRLYPPYFVTKFDKSNSKKIGIVICKKCCKNSKTIRFAKDVYKIATLHTTFIKKK